MAIAYRESMGQPFIDCYDCLGKRRLQEFEEESGLRATKFLETIKVRRGMHQGKIPKFLFDASAFNFYRKLLKNACRDEYEAAMLCTGFGIALRFHTKEYVPYQTADGMEFLRGFTGSPDWQIQTLAKDLIEAGSQRGESNAETFIRLKAQHYRRNNPANVGDRTWGLSEHFRCSYLALGYDDAWAYGDETSIVKPT